MIIDITYTNSRGEQVCFGTNRPDKKTVYHFTDTDLFNLKMGYRSIGDTITSMKKEIRQFSISAVMAEGTLEERDRFIDVVAYDLAVNQKGRIQVGNTYMECWINAVEASEWHVTDGHMAFDCTIITDTPVWVRTHIIELMPVLQEDVDGLNYPYDYPHNYNGSSMASWPFKNPFPTPAKCDIVFSGPCVKPYVIIGDNRYEVDENAENGELILIKGYGKKGIYRRSRTGTLRDIFSKGLRQKGASVFAEIPVGKTNAYWNGAYSITITLYEERFTPCWT